MAIVYNAEEIYAMGIEIEKNGREFYLQMAHKSDNATVKRLFTELAQWEERHVTLFSDLKDSLHQNAASAEPFDLDEMAHQYIKAAADSHIFLKKTPIDAIVARCNSPVDALRVALTFEKDSVVLYTSMRGIVPESLGKETINLLIDEEVKHVAIIQQQIDILK